MSTDFILSGNIYVDRLTDGGASTGYLEPAEIGKLEIKESTKLKTRKSKGRDTLAIVLLGEVAARHQAAGIVSVGATTLIALIPGRLVQLPHTNITPHVAITSPIVIATDATTPVDIPLADVEIDHRLGLVQYIGDTLTEATACTLTYKYGDETATRVSGSVKPTIKMRLLLDGKNLVTGDNVRVTIDEATLTPAKAIDFMADDWAEIELEGEMTTLPGKTSPYTVDIIATA